MRIYACVKKDLGQEVAGGQIMQRLLLPPFLRPRDVALEISVHQIRHFLRKTFAL